MHGTGEPPWFPDPEVNVSLICGDYYFIETLRRYAEVYGRTNVTYTPDPGFTGIDSFTYQVCDCGGNCSMGTVTVFVAGTNTAPAFNARLSLAGC